MKTKLLKKLRKEAKEEVYLTQSLYCSGSGQITIIHNVIDAPFGLTITFYDPVIDMFVQDEVAQYNTVEEALPDLAKARRYYILNILHSEYRTFSKGDRKRKEKELLKQQEYQKYLQQF
jgi:hypothetical protein